MYESQTADIVHQRMLDESPDGIDKRQGSITYDLTRPAANEVERLYFALDDVILYGFAGVDQPREYLEKRCAEIGIAPKLATKASGVVVFSGSEGTRISKGTIVLTEGEQPVHFSTMSDVTMTGTSVSVSVEAVQGGSKGNVFSGTVSLVSGNISGISSVTNPQPFEGGTDVESDESLLARYFDRLRKPITSGNVWHYREWARERPGVSDAKVFPTWNGPGTVRVVLLDDEKTAPSQTIVDDVAEYIESVRPVGAQVTVEAATEVTINVSAKLTLASYTTIDEVREIFEPKFREYLQSLAFNDPLVRYTQIARILLDIPPILDYADLTVNGKTGNIEIASDSVAIPGTVLFN